ELASSMSVPAALTELCKTFGLSPFERDVLLLCAGVEFDGEFAALCVEASAGKRQVPSSPGLASPTFALALSALPDAHWNALTPAAPLRRWRLIEVGHGSAFTLSPLRIDESILHYLAGTSYLDERLARLVRPLSIDGHLVPSHHILAERVVRAWSQQTLRQPSLRDAETCLVPLIQLTGEDVIGKQMIAATACSMLGLKLYMTSAKALPTAPLEIEAFIRLWEREAALSKSALLVDCDDLDVADREWATIMGQFMKDLTGFLIVTSHERLFQFARGGQAQGTVPTHRPVISFDVGKPQRSEQVVRGKTLFKAMSRVPSRSRH